MQIRPSANEQPYHLRQSAARNECSKPLEVSATPLRQRIPKLRVYVQRMLSEKHGIGKEMLQRNLEERIHKTRYK